MCVCVCVWERERESSITVETVFLLTVELASGCVCVWERESSITVETVFLLTVELASGCVCVRERERVFYYCWDSVSSDCRIGFWLCMCVLHPITVETQSQMEWGREVCAVSIQLAYRPPSGNSGSIWGNWELRKLETGKESEQPKPTKSQKTGFCSREWKKWLEVALDLTVWPEINSLGIIVFWYTCRLQVEKRMSFIFGKFLLPS